MPVVFTPKIVSEAGALALRVDVANRTAAPITLGTLHKYLAVELKNGLGQFLSGAFHAEAASRLPLASDYRTLDKNEVAEAVFVLPIAAVAGGWRVGDFVFTGVPASNTVRVTYKADLMTPNLASKLQRGFFRGPSEPRTVPIELPAPT